jgi:hypothetical protein
VKIILNYTKLFLISGFRHDVDEENGDGRNAGHWGSQDIE